MGAGWRQFSEKAKQKWHMTLDRSFPITANARNEMMMKEANEFATHLKRCEKDIRALKNATEGLLNTTKIVLSAPLPRVYEDPGNGKVQPVANMPGQSGTLIGGDFKMDDLTKISKETARKLDTEVLAPMHRWSTAFNSVGQARMAKLEALRLEVDSRRRTVQALTRKVDKQRARLPQTRAKGEEEMQATIKTMNHKENKLAAARQSFKEHEVLVYQQLAQLIRDGVWLKSYIAAVMRVEQEAFSTAYAAMGPAKTSAALPSTLPTEVSAVAAGTSPDLGVRDFMNPPQAQGAANPAGMIKSLTNKGARKASVGGKENIIDAPSAPTHRIGAAPAAPAGRYDRYGESGYGQPVPAW